MSDLLEALHTIITVARHEHTKYLEKVNKFNDWQLLNEPTPVPDPAIEARKPVVGYMVTEPRIVIMSPAFYEALLNELHKPEYWHMYVGVVDEKTIFGLKIKIDQECHPPDMTVLINGLGVG